MMDRWQGKIDYTDPANGKSYKLVSRPAVLMVRPRGWHLMEAHIHVDGAEVAGGIVDFALYLIHNHAAQKSAGTGPYFYLPKLESYLEGNKFHSALFYCEFEGHPEDDNFQHAIDELQFFAADIRMLGTYPENPYRRS